MALGVGYGLEYYKTGLVTEGRVTLEYALATGRLILGGQKDGSRLTPYLIGGGGVHTKLLKPSLGGKNHLLAGIGARIDFDRKPGGSGIDVLLIGTGMGPKTVGIRVGYSIAFGRIREKASPTATPEPTPSETPTLAEGQEARLNLDSSPQVAESIGEHGADVRGRPEAREFNVSPAIEEGLATGQFVWATERPTRRTAVWDLAGRKDMLGDYELYPILVDLNRDRIVDGKIDAGVPVILPAKVTPLMKKRARSDAWSKAYVPFRGRPINYTRYGKFKEMQRLIRIYGARTVRVTRGTNLWDMAGREEIYGDNWRFVDIYHANLDKIWNRDLIYPGQKFVLPNIPGPIPTKTVPVKTPEVSQTSPDGVPAGATPVGAPKTAPVADISVDIAPAVNTAVPAAKTGGEARPAVSSPAVPNAEPTEVGTPTGPITD